MPRRLYPRSRALFPPLEVGPRAGRGLMLGTAAITCLKALLPHGLRDAVVVDLGGGAADQLATLCLVKALEEKYRRAGIEPVLVLNLHRKLWADRSARLHRGDDKNFMRTLAAKKRSYDASGSRLHEMGFELCAFDLDWSFCQFAALPWRHRALYRCFGRIRGDQDKAPLLSADEPPRPPLWITTPIGLDTLQHPLLVGFIDGLRMSVAMSEANRRKLHEIESAEHAVCLHVRRGDYIAHRGGKTLPPEYFQQALGMLADVTRWEHLSVFVFSDDLDWARTKIDYRVPGRKVSVDFVTVNDIASPVPELWLMRACRAFVISSGRFALLAATLSPKQNKILVAPKDPLLASPEPGVFSVGRHAGPVPPPS